LTISSIVIPDSVTELGEYCFLDCANLSSVTIGSGITSLTTGAFARCTSLESINIPENVEKIQPLCFYGDTNLKTINLASNAINYIGCEAFTYCENLGNVKLGSGITSINQDTFAHCTSLTEAVVPKSVTSLLYGVFSYDTALTKVLIPKNVTEISSTTFKGSDNVTVYGYSGSTAESFCEENSIPFEEVLLYGDSNCDGEISVKDGTYIQRFLIEDEGYTIEENTKQYSISDVSGEGKISIKDATYIQKLLASVIKVLPAEQNEWYYPYL
ncbi:MAG: leucine-rich repeat protein, partial [Acutalibacteraceae bacterium]